jgi:hypothetical protein
MAPTANVTDWPENAYLFRLCVESRGSHNNPVCQNCCAKYSKKKDGPSDGPSASKPKDSDSPKKGRQLSTAEILHPL